jgi:hypothetical protein
LEAQLRRLSGENLAVQLVLDSLLHTLNFAIPGMRIHVLKAFDDTANTAEKLSLAAGSKAGHLPETLRVIEQMRAMLGGKSKPAREV